MNVERIQESIRAGLFGEGCKLVETHISWVVLGREHVWKFKKPMKFSFLDFCDAGARKLYCERELSLNRRLAGDVYEAVVGFWMDGDGLTDRGTGEPDEHAVRMKRLDTALEMDKMLERDLVGAENMQALGRLMARFHAGADRMPADGRSGWKAYWDDFQDIGSIRDWVEQEGSTMEQARFDADLKTAFHFLQAHAEVLEERMKEGWIRDLHGDLHAGNIFLYPEPVVFDCIEFNDHFRQIDVLNELAFLCMDLDVRGHSEHKRAFLESYQSVSPVLQGGEAWTLFHYFKAYRANIRAKVTALRAMQSEGESRLDATRESFKYLDWMHRYLESLHTVL